MDFETKIFNIKRKTIKLQIWDTSGSERYRYLIGSYLKNCQDLILVYDITNTVSFKNIPQWISFIEKNTSTNILKVLVGNKCDLSYRIVSEEEGIKLAQDYGMRYFEASAKTGINIQEIFNFFPFKILNLENEKSPIKNENKGFVNLFHNLINKKKIYNNQKENPSGYKNDIYNEELNRLKILLEQEKLKNENLSKKVEK